jgi:hypothetical protein
VHKIDPVEVLYRVETSPEINRSLRGELTSHWMAQMAHRKLSNVTYFWNLDDIKEETKQCAFVKMHCPCNKSTMVRRGPHIRGKAQLTGVILDSH